MLFPYTMAEVNFFTFLTKLKLTSCIAIGILMLLIESTGIQNKYDMKFRVNLKCSRKNTLMKFSPYQIGITNTKVIRMPFECLC